MDIREPTGHYSKRKSMGKRTPLVLLIMKFPLCGLTLDPVWEAPAKHLGIWALDKDQTRRARSPRQKCWCCACRVTFPHFQPDFHAAPVLFSQVCLAPKAVPVLWASGLSGCALKTSHSASLSVRGRAGEAAGEKGCVCSLTGAVPGHSSAARATLRGTSAPPGDALSLGLPSLSPLSARSLR